MTEHGFEWILALRHGAVRYGFAARNMGELNSRFALGYLDRKQICPASHDLMDTHPRKICFFPTPGRVLVKQVHNNTVIRREGEYANRIEVSSLAGEAELLT